jgi:hypothetical protein
MACACKVNKQIEKINKIYGTQETVKTDIRGLVSIFFKKILLFILYIPLIPFFSLYLLIRKFFTNKPIVIDKFVKRRRNVRNK